MQGLSIAELTVLDWIAAHLHTGILDAVVPWITRLGDKGLVWIGLGVLLLFMGKRQMPYGIQILLALVFSLILCNLLLKNAVDRVRPFALNTMAELLIPPPRDASFPSGHSSASFAAATVLMITGHRLRWAALVLAVLIAFSRLYLYVHFPTDVLAGILLGVLCGVLSAAVWRRWLLPGFPAMVSTGEEPEEGAP